MNSKYFRGVFVSVVVILLFYLVLFAASAHAEGGFSSGGIGLFMTGTRDATVEIINSAKDSPILVH